MAKNQLSQTPSAAADKIAHTPGLWIQERDGATGHDYSRIVLSNGFCIARVYPRPTIEESNANARLIASAPELLEALKNLLPIIDDAVQDVSQFFRKDSPAYTAMYLQSKSVRAAISKAEGK